MPFEIKTMRLRPKAFLLTFTKPVDAKAASELASYTIDTYTYIYREQYGSPEVDQTKPTLLSVKVAEDRMSVELTIDELQVGHVHELHAKGVRGTIRRTSIAPRSLLHAQSSSGVLIAWPKCNDIRE